MRVFSGPLVIIVVAKTLTTGEMSLYYAFFNVIALQQIMEMGIGFTIKQYISHSYKLTEKNEWGQESKANIISYMKFSFLWYLVISLFIFFILGYVGSVFFSSYKGSTDWKGAWWMLVFITGFFTIVTPFQFLIEGCQRQISIYKSRLLSGIFLSLVLGLSLYYGAGLYSIAIAVFISNLIFYLYLFKTIKELVSELIGVKTKKNIKTTFIEVWDMLSKISVTWILGYFFWNSFNLIAFKMLTNDLAGRFGFTLSLVRAGYSIAESIVASQTTIYASYISAGEVKLARRQFEKSMYISMALLISGYFLYIAVYKILPGLFIFDKTLNLTYTIEMFLYFVLLLPVTSQANYCRCFKNEPYFKLSLFMNIQVPIVFYLTCYYVGEPNFIYLLPFSMLSLIWSCYIYYDTENRYKIKCRQENMK
ncbi:Wzx [Yersinia mollaretii ATCC 43969]|uniref:Wzx n=1 Tax=Yersinia mollaretii (strain ATCC 43969 / DSM 18520 / CIP 103324 / CNY 7263 / WAIP 204) TaxID=349967 RepID=A0ABP2EIW3_YERMW|nr:Wzx [Yersinia mollaretii ATCC 43969]